jgi:hypothetical protein
VDLGVLLSTPARVDRGPGRLATVAVVLVANVLLRRGLRWAQSRVLAAIAPLLALTASWRCSRDAAAPAGGDASGGRGARGLHPGAGRLPPFRAARCPLLVVPGPLIALGRVGRGPSRTDGRRAPGAAARWRAALARRSGSPGSPNASRSRCRCRYQRSRSWSASRRGLRRRTRRPILVLGAELLQRLDVEELEGVLAHELAHVRRRDTPVAGMPSVWCGT